MALNLQEYITQNYLVPADGSTHCVPATLTASATAITWDWASISAQLGLGNTFIPQGVIVDNSAGTDVCELTFAPFNTFTFKVEAGAIRAFLYPAARQGQGVSITGLGTVNLLFVDFPIMPGLLYTDSTIGASVSIVGQPIETTGSQEPLTGGFYRTANAGDSIIASYYNTNNAADTSVALNGASRIRATATTQPVALSFAAIAAFPAAGALNANVLILAAGETRVIDTSGQANLHWWSAAVDANNFTFDVIE